MFVCATSQKRIEGFILLMPKQLYKIKFVTGKLVTISLSGYIFFGSAVKILQEVKNNVVLTAVGENDEIFNSVCTKQNTIFLP